MAGLVETKKCSKCKVEKELSEFSKDKKFKDGRYCRCRKCEKIRYQNNKIKILFRSKRWKDNNKEYVKETSKQYYQNNKEKANSWHNNWVNKNKEFYKEYQKIYRKKNKKYYSEYNKRYKKQRRQNDVEFKILTNLRMRLNLAIKNDNKSDSIKHLLGCSIKDLRKHLKFQFKEGMTWDNYGRKKGIKCWEIDHIKPCVSFDLSKELEQQKCFHYTNLQPLWADENLIKGAKT